MICLFSAIQISMLHNKAKQIKGINSLLYFHLLRFFYPFLLPSQQANNSARVKQLSCLSKIVIMTISDAGRLSFSLLLSVFQENKCCTGVCPANVIILALFVDVFIYLFLHLSTFLKPLFMSSNNHNRAAHQTAVNKTVSV